MHSWMDANRLAQGSKAHGAPSRLGCRSRTADPATTSRSTHTSLWVMSSDRTADEAVMFILRLVVEFSKADGLGVAVFAGTTLTEGKHHAPVSKGRVRPTESHGRGEKAVTPHPSPALSSHAAVPMYAGILANFRHELS